MNDLAVLWLQMLLVVLALSWVQRARQGWRWHLGSLVQLALVALIAAYGAWVGSASTCMWLAWALYFAVTAWPAVLVRRVQARLRVYDVRGAEEEAQRLGLFAWGAPGRFWLATVQAHAATLDGSPSEGRALLRGYLGPGTPVSYRLLALQSLQRLQALEQDWIGLVTSFEAAGSPSAGPSFELAADVHRAYLELGEVGAARRLLDQLTGRPSPGEVDGLAIAFYALAGAPAPLEAALMRSKQPEYVAEAWRARCFAAQGELEAAKAAMRRAITLVPEELPGVASRLEAQLAELRAAPTPGLLSETAREVALAQERFAALALGASILAPARHSWGFGALVAAIALAFIPAHLYLLFPGARTESWAEWILAHGALDASAWGHEPWRFISYQFLHADVMHVGLNLLVLWAFGRQAESLFGPFPALAGFVITGVVGGMAQLWMAPDAQTIGASGAVLGVFGMVGSGLFRSKEALPDAVRKERVRGLVSIAVFQMAIDQLFAGQIAVYVHAAGLLSGALLGLVLPLVRAKELPRGA